MSDTEGADLSADELRRYGRHLLLPQVGLEGQRRLKAARVLLVGAGGLGSPVALYLAAAGVGNITIVDDDVVDVSNLQRQVLHDTADIGVPKAESARARLRALNPHVHVEPHTSRFTAANARALVAAHDVVIDGSDNFATRYLVNDACVREGRPDVHASVFRFEGQVSVFATPGGPCYRCIFPEPPPPGTVPSCDEAGVLGVLPGVLGTIQATEALKLILGIGDPLIGRLLTLNLLGMTWRTIHIPRDPDCPACGPGDSIQLPAPDAEAPGAVQPRSMGSTSTIAPLSSITPQERDVLMSASIPEITPRELADRLAAGERPCLLDVREQREWDMAHLPEARHVPLGSLEEALSTLDPAKETIVYCRSGARSATAVRQLKAAGFTNVSNLAGGILRWSDEVDPSIQKY